MRRGIAVAGCSGLIFLAGWAFGRDKALVLNGTNWKTFSASEKIMYAYGFSQGYRQGVPDGTRLMGRWIVKMLANTHCAPPVSALSEDESRKEMEAEAQAQKYPFYGDPRTTLSRYVDTVSVFYSDYRNVPVCWDNALRFSASSLAGRAPTEQELQAARRSDAESGCR